MVHTWTPHSPALFEGHTHTHTHRHLSEMQSVKSVKTRVKFVRRRSWKHVGGLRLRGVLSIPPQFICDVVYFNRFSNDSMLAAYNPFDPPIVNTKISIRERTGWLEFPCGSTVGGNVRIEKKYIYFIWFQRELQLCVLERGRGVKGRRRDGGGQTLIWDSVGEKGTSTNKKKKERDRERALGMNMCVGEKRYTAELQEKESQPGGRQIDSSPESHNKHPLFFSLHSSPLLLQPDIVPSALHLYHSPPLIPSPLSLSACWSQFMVSEANVRPTDWTLAELSVLFSQLLDGSMKPAATRSVTARITCNDLKVANNERERRKQAMKISFSWLSHTIKLSFTH